jgi:hypothetical protein
MVAPHSDTDLEHNPISRGGKIGEARYKRLKLVTRPFLGEEA